MSAVVPPPPPTGSILQKQSSFSRSKAGATTTAAASAAANKAPSNTPQTKPETAPAQTPNLMAAKPAGPMPSTAAAPTATPSRPIGGAAPPPPAGKWGPNGQLAPASTGAYPPAMSPAAGVKRPAQPPANQKMGAYPPAMSPAAGVMRAAPAPGPAGQANANTVAATPRSAPAAAGGAKRPANAAQVPPTSTPRAVNGAATGAPPASTPALARKNSKNGDMGGGFGSMGPGGPMGGYGSMGPGGPMGGYGSMGPMGGYGSMGPGGPMGGYGSMGPGGAGAAGMGSMYGPVNRQGSMMGPMGGSMFDGKGANTSTLGPMGGSMYGQNPNGMGDAAAAGSMYGQNPGAGSMMGPMGGSMYGAGGLFGSMGPGSMMAPNSMMGPMGSMYGMGGPMAGSMYGGMSTYGIAAQWGSLANMSAAGRGSTLNRSGISSEYGGFAAEAATVDLDDLCPNIETFDDAKDLKRSGKRGGNHLYSRDKHEKIVTTNNSNAQALTIKRKADVKASSAAGGSASPAADSSARSTKRGTAAGAAPTGSSSTSNGGKARAKVPSNYNVHSLIVVDKAGKTAVTTVKDPSTVVYEKGGKKETFEADEAIERAGEKEEVDSVLLSELRSNWFNGHCSSLMMCAGKGKKDAAQTVVRDFMQKCIDRLEKNEKETGVKFDVTMTMVALRGADQCCDLLKNGADYVKMAMGSSPIYGPCLRKLEAKVVKSGAEATSHFDAGLKNAKEEKEIVAVFYVLKTIKKTGAEVDVHLSSMCVALCGETVTHMTDIKDKAPSSPHRLFRYAIDGACVTVSGLCISSDDEEAQGALEVERKVREVKNMPPRSGNVRRFIEFTYKEIARQKEKASAATDEEKKAREAQIERMEEMVKDANELLSEPEKTQPKGYSTDR